MTRNQALRIAANMACNEAEKAVEKYPPFNSTHEGYAVLKEEVDEAWEEIRRNNKPLAVQEMIQVAAMALRFIAEFSEQSNA